MSGPMEGIRVVEVGFWVAGPSCSGILADWGADVVKVEPRAGDPFRGLTWFFGGNSNPPFELDNRGKRSLALDYRTPEGREVLYRLIDQAEQPERRRASQGNFRRHALGRRQIVARRGILGQSGDRSGAWSQ